MKTFEFGPQLFLTQGLNWNFFTDSLVVSRGTVTKRRAELTQKICPVH